MRHTAGGTGGPHPPREHPSITLPSGWGADRRTSHHPNTQDHPGHNTTLRVSESTERQKDDAEWTELALGRFPFVI